AAGRSLLRTLAVERTHVYPSYASRFWGSGRMNRNLLWLATSFLAACAPGAAPDNSAAERLAIIELQNRYVLAMDYFDADGYAAVFTEDGVLDWARGEVKGRPAIREFMASGTYDLRKLNFAPAQTPDGKEWPPMVRH